MSELTGNMGSNSFRDLNIKINMCDDISSPDIFINNSCPRCKNDMSDENIAKGWLEDPTDWTTKCIHCDERYEARMEGVFEKSLKLEAPYLCKAQLEHELRRLVDKSLMSFNEVIFLRDLISDETTIYLNCIRHFETLDNAFKEMNVDIITV
jgi:hypothetical protein